MAANDKNTNPIEEAKRIAREAIEQAHDIAIELDEPTEGMCEFDAITIEDEECDVAEIAIMHDYDRTGSPSWSAPARTPPPYMRRRRRCESATCCSKSSSRR